MLGNWSVTFCSKLWEGLWEVGGGGYWGNVFLSAPVNGFVPVG